MKRLFILGAFLFSGFVFASPIHNVIVFGDSLSDSGNLYAHMDEKLPPSPPYFDGHFSNGPVWFEYLSHWYFPKSCSHFINYAFGGAMVSSEEVADSPLFTLDGQVKQYLSDHPDDKHIQDNLFIVWIGSNNYLGTPEDPDGHLVRKINQEIMNDLELLIKKGAKNILVFNLPDIGRTPFAAFLDENSCSEDHKTCKSEVLTQLSKTHNEILSQELEKIKLDHPDVNWIFFDLSQLFDEVMANPAMYNIANVDSACFTPNIKSHKKQSLLEKLTDIKLQSSTSCDDYLFFDLLHPTTAAHKVIAEKIRALLEEADMDIH